MSFADRMERAAFTMRMSNALEKMKRAERSGNETEGRRAAEELRAACQKYPQLAIEAGLADWIG